MNIELTTILLMSIEKTMVEQELKNTLIETSRLESHDEKFFEDLLKFKLENPSYSIKRTSHTIEILNENSRVFQDLINRTTGIKRTNTSDQSYDSEENSVNSTLRSETITSASNAKDSVYVRSNIEFKINADFSSHASSKFLKIMGLADIKP